MSVIKSYKDLLTGSYSELYSFINNKELENRVSQPVSVYPIRVHAQLQGGWWACQKITFPVRACLSELLAVVFIYPHIISFPRITYIVDRLRSGFADFSKDSTQVYKLATTYNFPDKASKALTKQSVISQSAIKDKKSSL